MLMEWLSWKDKSRNCPHRSKVRQLRKPVDNGCDLCSKWGKVSRLLALSRRLQLTDDFASNGSTKYLREKYLHSRLSFRKYFRRLMAYGNKIGCKKKVSNTQCVCSLAQSQTKTFTQIILSFCLPASEC